MKGYEFYGGMAKTYSKMKDESFRKKATEFYVKIQVVGTPDDCIQQIGRAAAADRPRPPGRPSSATAACRTRRPSSTCACSPTA